MSLLLLLNYLEFLLSFLECDFLGSDNLFNLRELFDSENPNKKRRGSKGDIGDLLLREIWVAQIRLSEFLPSLIRDGFRLEFNE